MKKILFIIPCIPYPLTTGGNQAFFHMVDYLRCRMSVSILLYPKGKEKEDVEKLKRIWNNVDFFIFTEQMAEPETRHPSYYKWLKKIALSATRKMRRQLLTYSKDVVCRDMTLDSSFFEPLPSKYAEYISTVSRRGFDIIQVEFYPLISLGYLLPENVQTIFVHHELRYVRNENEMEFLERVTDEERMLYRIGKDFEHSALKTYKHVIVLTEVDRQILIDFIGNKHRIHVSPAVVQMTDACDKQVVPTTSRLTFVGSEGHYPNLDAVVWFCQEIAPCLRNQNFHFTFQVVGPWRSSYVKELQISCPELELVGYVEDLHNFLNGSIVLVPIRIGSGMRMKILDAVSSKAPFVTTTKGVEGIDFDHEEECLIADSASDFASAVIRLTGDEGLQVKLANQAVEQLQKFYNPQEMLDRRLAVYNQILE